MTKWIVSYRLNGKLVDREFDSRLLAELEMIKLLAYNLEPTLHEKINNG